MQSARRTFIAGGAGFLGSHFADRLLADAATERLTIYDNFSSGHRWHLAGHVGDPRLVVVEADIRDEDRLAVAMTGHELVIHLASNPDIARAATDPDVDFRQGTLLTRNVVEAARRTGAHRLLYASGSGVYGDRGAARIAEDDGPFEPVSTYGASKLAGEALIAAYAHMFGVSACAFRFGNVVGPRQTHGVGYDFLRKLWRDPRRLEVLGDGRQSKPYVHAEDVVAAVLLAGERSQAPYAVYNVATDDLLAVRDIAELATAALGLDPRAVEVTYQPSPRGWAGDVPVVSLDSGRIRALGWRPTRTSREAMAAALAAMHDELVAAGERRLILARSPLRISLGGGGTDLPSYYRRFGGLVVSAAIDKYVYVAVNRTFLPHMLIRYSRIETVGDRREIAHPIIREALAMLEVEDGNLEITTLADIPAGTGLGSSGSFTTALLKALYRYRRQLVEPARLAELACHIEIDLLGEPVGKQDQYVAAYGGLSCFQFHTDERVTVEPLAIPEEALGRLEDGMLMFSTGIVRRSSTLLADQDRRTRDGDSAMLENLHATRQIGEASRAALLAGDVDELGRLMHEHWLAKRVRSPGMSSDEIDDWYEAGRAAGAIGGKLIGAGGGGFLLFVTSDPGRLRAALAARGLAELRFAFDFEGSKVL